MSDNGQWFKDALVHAGPMAPFLGLILLGLVVQLISEAPVFTLVTVLGAAVVLIVRRRRRSFGEP